jgi:DNA-binding NarL/FixJ family response regulator
LPLMTQLQIIIDIVFFIIIMFFLHQLKKHMARMPWADGTTIDQVKKLITESKKSTDLFLSAVHEGEERFGNLARQLDNREKRMLILIEIAESLIQKMGLKQATAEPEGSNDNKYLNIKMLVGEGLSREAVAERLGITVGEVELVMELEQTRMVHS